MKLKQLIGEKMKCVNKDLSEEKRNLYCEEYKYVYLDQWFIFELWVMRYHLKSILPFILNSIGLILSLSTLILILVGSNDVVKISFGIVSLTIAIFIIKYMKKSTKELNIYLKKTAEERENDFEKSTKEFLSNKNILKLQEIIKQLSWIIGNDIRMGRGRIVTRRAWKRLKRNNFSLYQDLITDECLHKCYLYSRELALELKNVNLVWCSIVEPTDNKRYAHAFIKKGNEMYCTNVKRITVLKDYEKLHDMEIYKEWTYQEYSSETFYKDVREGFYNWCEENNVGTYDKF